MPLGVEDCAVTYKVLILGDDSVGKSALLDSLMGRSFKENMYPTIGVDFVRKIFEVDGALVQLAIWDTAGQERFRSITRLQYKGVQGLILVYDVTNELTFETLKYWIHSIQDEISRPDETYEPIPMILCGNKCDLIREKKVSTAKGQKMADREMAFGFYETSARTGDNVYRAFQDLAYHVTDICHPKLMKSYHPHLIRPISQHDPKLRQDNNLRQFKPKSRFRPRHGKSSQPSETRARALSSSSSSKGDHSNNRNSKILLSSLPWEEQEEHSLGSKCNGNISATTSAVSAKSKMKSKYKNKDRKKIMREGARPTKSTTSVLRKTLSCLFCGSSCHRKKSTRQRDGVV